MQDHPGQQDSVRSFSSKDKPVRKEKRNINASIFGDSDDEGSTAMDQLPQHVQRQPDVSKNIVSCECLCERCVSSKTLQRNVVPHCQAVHNCLQQDWRFVYVRL